MEAWLCITCGKAFLYNIVYTIPRERYSVKEDGSQSSFSLQKMLLTQINKSGALFVIVTEQHKTTLKQH